MALRPETELAKITARIAVDLDRRDELIVQMSSEGKSLAQIAVVANLGRTGVADVLRRKRPFQSVHPVEARLGA